MTGIDPVGLYVEIHQKVSNVIADALLAVLGPVATLHRDDDTAA